MEPLATFTDAEVLGDDPPSNWKMITLSRPTEPEQPDQGNQRKRSHSRSWRAHARGTFMAAHSMRCLKPTATTWAVSPSLVPTQKVESWQEESSSWWWTPPPGYTDIARSLWGDDPPHEVMSIPLGPAKEQGPIWIVGSTMFSARLLQDVVSGTTYINMVTSSMSLVDLGVTPSVGDCSIPTLFGGEDTDSN